MSLFCTFLVESVSVNAQRIISHCAKIPLISSLLIAGQHAGSVKCLPIANWCNKM